MIDENWIFLGLLLAFTADAKYIFSMFKGKAKPNRVTWALWALAPLVAFVGEIDEGVGIRTVFTLSVGIGPLVIFILSFFVGQAYWSIKNRDYVMGAISVAGLILWAITGEGELAVIFAIIADTMAALPTVLKSYTNPETEEGLAYALIIPNAIIALLIVDEWTFINVAYPIYILAMVLILAVLIQFKIGPRITARMKQREV